MSDEFLRFHGDVDAANAHLDFAVNVRGTEPPPWLLEALTEELSNIASYPSAQTEQQARQAVADFHGIPASHVLLLAGAAEGFSLLPRLVPAGGSTLAVHPSFTEPEYALRAAGVPVVRLLLDAPFTLPASLPNGVDMAVVGNPTNPTGVLHDPARLLAWDVPHLVVDEAFMDVVGEEHSLAARVVDNPQLIVLRSLTKTWALAGLRCGYVLAQPEVLAQLSAGRPHWPLGSVQLRAIAEVMRRGPAAAEQIAGDVARERAAMVRYLEDEGFRVVAGSSAPFVLVRPPTLDPESARLRLLDRGVAVRRCDTFPGLDQGFWRLAVRDMDAVQHLLEEYRQVVKE